MGINMDDAKPTNILPDEAGQKSHGRARIVVRSRRGNSLSTVRLMTAAEESLLKAHHSGLGSPAQRKQLEGTVGALLAEIRRIEGWVACGCLDDETSSENPPTLHPRQSQAGSLYLVRNTYRPSHAEGCVFAWDHGELGASIEEESEVGRALPKAREVRQPDFIVYRDDAPNAPVPNDLAEIRNTSLQRHRDDPLARRLFWLIQAAGFDAIHSDAPIPPMSGQFKKLRDAAASITVAGAIRLSDILWTDVKWHTQAWAFNRLKNLGPDVWPCDLPKQGFLVVPAEDVEGHDIVVSSAPGQDPVTIRIDAPVRKFALDGQEARAPYIAIISARMDDNGQRMCLHRAYAHPRYCRLKPDGTRIDTIIPVDSNYERAALGALDLALWKWAKSEAQKSGPAHVISVKKPLFDIAGRDGNACRPDFIVDVAGKGAFVVETMGRKDLEYRRRKEATHLLMAGIPQVRKVFLDYRAEVLQKEADRRLYTFFHGFANSIVGAEVATAAE